jgi:hypothetical protein
VPQCVAAAEAAALAVSSCASLYLADTAAFLSKEYSQNEPQLADYVNLQAPVTSCSADSTSCICAFAPLLCRVMTDP